MLHDQPEKLAPYRHMADLLDSLQVGLGLFDEADRMLLWNRSFLRLFPEHVGHVEVGEPYHVNLRRFYRKRLSPSEMVNIEKYITAGIQRHRSQTMPFVFEHGGQWIKVASDPIPGLGRLRIWTPIAQPDAAHGTGRQETVQPFLADDGDAAVHCDAAGRLVHANTRFLQLFDLTCVDAAKGRTLADLFAAVWSRGSSDSEAASRWQLTLAEAEHFPGTPFQLPLPGERWLRILQKVLADGGTLSTIADISEMKRLQYGLEAARNAAELANRTKDQFLAVVSHELRTPMNGILGMLDLLNDDQLDRRHKDKVEVARQSAQSLLGLLDDILGFSRMQSGRIDLDPVETDPTELVASAARLVEPSAREKGLAFRWTTAPGLPERLLLDPDRLRQVLLNLLGNAIKFTETGEVTVHVRAGDLRSDGRRLLHVEVSDSGIGIPAEARARIFEPFVQADNRIGRRFGGTGLGLAICRQVVEAMEGTISVDSAEGIGSRFSVVLPCGLPDGTAASVAAAPVASLPPLSVLVADDNGVNREVARLLLERLGATVTVTADGPSAIEACRTPFDLILLDIEMPGMDGYETARAIRDGDSVNARTPIVALTAHVGEQYKSMSGTSGMQGFITKPLRLSSLAREIASAIGLDAEAA